MCRDGAKFQIIILAMAGNELDSFVRKFMNLWQSGWDAKLNLESEAGNVFVTLRVGLGEDPIGHHQQVVHHRGGGPARQRRRERRESERKVTKAAEEAVIVKVEHKDTTDVVAEEAPKKSDKMTEEVAGKHSVTRIDSAVDDGKAHFELKVDAHEKCTNQDVVEAIKENFFGTLDIKKVGKVDPVRHLIIKEDTINISKVQDKYTIAVRENEIAIETVGLWNEPYEFDDLAFKNAVYDKVKIKIKEVKRTR